MARRPNINSVLALADKLEPDVRDAFVQAILDARAGIGLAEITAALEAGNVQRVVDLVSLDRRLLFPIDKSIQNSFEAGAGMVVDAAKRSGVIIGFDGRHPRAEKWVRERAGNLITNIIEDRDDKIDSIRGIINKGLEEGWNPRRSALDIAGRVNRATGRREGGIIGLDGPRTERYRVVAENLDSPAGVRSLVTVSRDGDISVKYKVNAATKRRIISAYKKGEGLSSADRSLSLKQYGNQLLRERAETIARTEAITALRAGRREGFEQAVEQGAVDADAITRRWSATGDARTREDHQAMNNETLSGLDATWTLPDGSVLKYPGDPSGPPEQIIMCRCYEEYVVDFLK